MSTPSPHSHLEQHDNDFAPGDPKDRDAIRRAAESVSPTLMTFAERGLAEAQLRPGSRVLDIGTQFGTVAVMLAREGMSVLATDISEPMVEHVRAYGIKAIEARVMDGEALDLPDESFDAAFTMFGVTHFDDWRAGLAEMHRVLRPGGVSVVGTWTSAGGAGAVRALHLLCEELFPATPPPELPVGVVEMQSQDRFERAMVDAGFSGVRIVYERQVGHIHPHDLDSPDSIFSWSSQWAHLSKSQRRTVVEIMRTRADADGKYAVESTAGIAVGWRP